MIQQIKVRDVQHGWSLGSSCVSVHLLHQRHCIVIRWYNTQYQQCTPPMNRGLVVLWTSPLLNLSSPLGTMHECISSLKTSKIDTLFRPRSTAGLYLDAFLNPIRQYGISPSKCEVYSDYIAVDLMVVVYSQLFY